MDQRPGQTFIGLKVSEVLFSKVEEASKGKDKSQFVREAIAEKLRRDGYSIKEESVAAPSRKGKGGPRKYRVTKSKSKEKKK